MGTLDDVTGDFPATWISGGNADPLTASQPKPMAARLSELGVDVTTVFYSDGTVPARTSAARQKNTAGDKNW